MTREIKFLAWDSQQHVMSEPFELWGIVKWPGSKGASLPTSVSLVAEMARRGAIRLLQFTGLRDRKGKEIYEGQIYKSISWKTYLRDFQREDQPILIKVVWHQPSLKWCGELLHPQGVLYQLEDFARDGEGEVLGHTYEDSDPSEPQVSA